MSCGKFKDKFPKVIIHEKTCPETGREPSQSQKIFVYHLPQAKGKNDQSVKIKGDQKR